METLGADQRFTAELPLVVVAQARRLEPMELRLDRQPLEFNLVRVAAAVVVERRTLEEMVLLAGAAEEAAAAVAEPPRVDPAVPVELVSCESR